MMKLGEKIRLLRQGCYLTQEELADRCELTKGYISQVENDLTSPSIATLVDILAALGTTLKDFFNEDEEEKIVFVEEDFIEKVDGGRTTNWLIPNSQKNMMEPLRIQLEPEAETYEDVPHEGEEFGYVLEGQIVLHIGSKKMICKKGNSFYYTADKMHYISNNGKKPAVFIWVSTPPTF